MKTPLWLSLAPPPYAPPFSRISVCKNLAVIKRARILRLKGTIKGRHVTNNVAGRQVSYTTSGDPEKVKTKLKRQAHRGPRGSTGPQGPGLSRAPVRDPTLACICAWGAPP